MVMRALERILIVLEVVHPAAGLDIEFLSAAAIFHGAPAASGQTDAAIRILVPASELLNMQQCLQLDGIERTVPVLGNLYLGKSFDVFMSN